MKRSIRYGEVKIGFTIRFTSGGRRRVAINVLPDGEVRVDAPDSATPDEVVAAVRQRARWVWQQLEACKEHQRFVLPREYVSGESHFYLGRRHVLKVLVSADAKPGVRLWLGRLEVVVAQRDPAAVSRLLDAWYRERAREVFARRLAEVVDSVSWLRAPPPFRLLNMRTQWGSCSTKGQLVLNPQLVKASRNCVDYVLAHELCHLKEHNHSVRYYQLLGRMMPDWEVRKKELDAQAELILNR